jgi:integrase
VVRLAGYDPATGKRRVRQLGTFATKRAALACARAAGEGWAGGEDESLAAFLEDVWLPSKEGRVEVATYDQYRWAVTRHVVPLIGAVRLRDLTAEVVDDWLRDIAVTEPDARPRLGPTSARLVRKVLSMACEEAVQRGRLGRNPVGLTQPPRPSRATPRLGWTLEEARAFLDAIAGHRLAAAFQVCLVTGLRRGRCWRWAGRTSTSTGVSSP